MAEIYFDMIRRKNSHAYIYGDLVSLEVTNGHVYFCTIPGTTAASVPAFNTGAGATTTDGGVQWTEFNPTGIYFWEKVTPTNPKWGDIEREIKYVQPMDFSNGGDLYRYDKGIAAKEIHSITYQFILEEDVDNLLNLVALVRGGKFPFMYYDTNGDGHKVILLNSDSIKRKQNMPRFDSLSTPLQLLFI